MSTPIAPPIMIGNLLLNCVDLAGVAWPADIVSGWLGSPKPTISNLQKPRDDGSWSGDSFLTPRVISLSGLIEAPTEAALFTAISLLNAAISKSATPLQAYYAGQTLACPAVRRMGDVLIDPVDDLSVSWSAIVTADDPRKYSAVITQPVPPGASVTIHNYGDFRAPVYLSIAGPCNGPSITHSSADDSGSTLRLDPSYALAAGAALVLDCQNHSAIESGVTNQSTYLTSRGWFWLDPGDNTFDYATTAGAGQLTVTTRSAWQ